VGQAQHERVTQCDDHRIAVLAQVNPVPSGGKINTSPRVSRPLRTASCLAIANGRSVGN